MTPIDIITTLYCLAAFMALLIIGAVYEIALPKARVYRLKGRRENR